ncbi:hypothetical protein GCM10022270_16360 [Terriglobus aquaticus]
MKSLTLAGSTLIALGLIAFSLGERLFYFDDYTLYLWLIGLGLVSFTVGAIGWSILLKKQERRRMGAFLILCPTALVLLVGSFNPNVHGIFPLFFITLVPIWLLGVIVLLTSFR